MPTGYTLRSGKKEVIISVKCPMCSKRKNFTRELFVNNKDIACYKHKEEWLSRLKELEIEACRVGFSWNYRELPGTGIMTSESLWDGLAEFVANNLIS